jgi:type III secretion system YscD/HrpQ family protein
VLSPLEGEVLVDGVPVHEEILLENPMQVITAGDTHFVVGSMDQEWPEINIPKERQMAVELTDFPAEQSKPTPQKSNFKKFLVGGCILFLVVFGAYFAYEAVAGKTKKSVVIASKSTSYLQKLSQTIKEVLPEKKSAKVAASQPIPQTTPLSDLTGVNSAELRVSHRLLNEVPQVFFSVNEGAPRKKVEIWVRGEEACRKARRILEEASPPILYNLVDLAQLETSAVTLARLFGFAIDVRVDPGGTAFWTGYLRDEKGWQSFFPHASQELPGIRDNRCEVVFGNQLVSKLRSELQQQGFDKKVRPVASETGISLEGFVPPEQKKNWDSWLAAIREKYPVAIADRMNSQPTNPSLKEFFQDRVVGVAGNILPWVTLSNGLRLFPGAKLKNGYTLEAITGNSIRVSGPDGTVDLSLSSAN